MVIQLKPLAGVHAVKSVDDIRDAIESIGEATNWLLIDDQMVGAFFHNGEHACVYRDDCGGWSHNPGNSWVEMALFVLENGQLDEFPMVHCIDYDAAMNAFIELARTGNRSADIQWFPPVA